MIDLTGILRLLKRFKESGLKSEAMQRLIELTTEYIEQSDFVLEDSLPIILNLLVTVESYCSMDNITREHELDEHYTPLAIQSLNLSRRLHSLLFAHQELLIRDHLLLINVLRQYRPRFLIESRTQQLLTSYVNEHYNALNLHPPLTLGHSLANRTPSEQYSLYIMQTMSSFISLLNYFSLSNNLLYSFVAESQLYYWLRKEFLEVQERLDQEYELLKLERAQIQQEVNQVALFSSQAQELVDKATCDGQQLARLNQEAVDLKRLFSSASDRVVATKFEHFVKVHILYTCSRVAKKINHQVGCNPEAKASTQNLVDELFANMSFSEEELWFFTTFPFSDKKSYQEDIGMVYGHLSRYLKKISLLINHPVLDSYVVDILRGKKNSLITPFVLLQQVLIITKRPGDLEDLDYFIQLINLITLECLRCSELTDFPIIIDESAINLIKELQETCYDLIIEPESSVDEILEEEANPSLEWQSFFSLPKKRSHSEIINEDEPDSVDNPDPALKCSRL